jgi:hypothetical protein
MNWWAVLWDMMCVITVKVVNMNVIWLKYFVPCDLIHVSQLNLKNCVMLKKWIVQEIGTYDVFISTIFIGYFVLNKMQGIIINPLNSKGNYSGCTVGS